MSTLTFKQNIIEHVRAGYQIILIPTVEEARAEMELRAACTELELEYQSWDQIAGFQHDETILNPTDALLSIPKPEFFRDGKHHMCVFKDLHNFYDSPDVRRALRSMSERVVLNNSKQRRPLILIQPSERVHPDLASCITTLEFTLPTPAQLENTFESIRRSIKDETKRVCPDELKHHIVQSMRGLTSTEAANCLSLCIIRHKGFTPDLIETIERAKANTLKKTEVLTYVPKDEIPPITDLGGYDELIDWVRQRALAYTPQADQIGLDRPKGALVMGVPGTGKSVMSMAVAKTLGLPLLEFDFSSVFNALVGASEARVREVIRLVTAIDGCVLVIDEADKALGGSTDATGDSGVTRRVFGVLLTWLARKKDRTFVIMTMNRTKGMPPELLRKGRFDEMFYVDIPSDEERRKIFEIHMTKRNIDPAFYPATEWKKFLKASNEFVGSEIEEAVKSGRFTAFQLGQIRKLINDQTAAKGKDKDKFSDLLTPYSNELKTKALDLTPEEFEYMSRGVPSAEQLIAATLEVGMTKVTKVDKDNIAEIRKFGQERARPVSRERRLSGAKGGRNLEVDVDSN
jgi:SpoVK/Ycf46/Vps4 family AAA+-type ATPase